MFLCAGFANIWTVEGIQEGIAFGRVGAAQQREAARIELREGSEITQMPIQDLQHRLSNSELLFSELHPVRNEVSKSW